MVLIIDMTGLREQLTNLPICKILHYMMERFEYR